MLSAQASAGRIALGSDSRLTGSNDLLDEMRVARDAGASPEVVLQMVTTWAATVLRLPDAGRIVVGGPADLIVVPAVAESAALSVLACRRSTIALVMRRGTPVVGDPSLASAFECRGIHVRPVPVDGGIRLVEAGLARRIERTKARDKG
ncbi:MAG: amidohydrolase family protein [Vicinamibacterales bacterium]